MSLALFLKLFGLIAVAVIGYVAARLRAFGAPDASRVLANAAFTVFAPALLFRTTARMDMASLPWTLLVAFFLPSLLWMAAVRGVTRRRGPSHPAAPAVRATTLGFGNSVQVGIPMAATMFGDTGLQMHLSIVSLHALVLLGSTTVWVELDLAHAAARQAGGRTPLWATLRQTVRSALIHPVVTPVLLGFAWNLLGLPLPEIADGVLQLLGQAVVPLCLVLIGVSLAEFNLRGALGAAMVLSALKLLCLPLLVGCVAWFGFGLRGTALGVVVMAAALPVGSNPLLFAQRYGTLEAETTGAVVLSTAAYALTAPLWLSLLAWLGRLASG